jgi:hypothetical protein
MPLSKAIEEEPSAMVIHGAGYEQFSGEKEQMFPALFITRNPFRRESMGTNPE